MKRWVVAVVVAVAAVAAFAVWRVAENRRCEWTTSSPEALAEFDAAMEARMKVYYAEAQQHLARAVELDPDFVMAKVMLTSDTAKYSEDGLTKLKELLAGVDLEALNERERFLLGRMRAEVDGQPEEGQRLLQEYLAKHPADPFALNMEGSHLWQSGQFDAAKKVFQRLLKVAPNWVVGYNSLGYIEMQQGNFAKSEEYFSTYRFIAPDQANPHDSLGELLMLTGRYDEAEGEVNEALEVRPDFCASYEHLAVAHLLQHDVDAAKAAVERGSAQPACEQMTEGLRCATTVWGPAAEHRWQSVIDAARDGCWGDNGPSDSVYMYVHRAAAFLGDTQTSEAIENRLAESLDKTKNMVAQRVIGAILHHLRGTRAAAEHRFDDAVAELDQTDDLLTYEGSQRGLLKLLNRLCLAEVLATAGKDEAAAKMIREVRRVNPPMADSYQAGKWRPYGLEK